MKRLKSSYAEESTVPIEDGFEGGIHGPCLWGRGVSRGLDIKIESCQANQELPGVQKIFRAGPTIAVTYLEGGESSVESVHAPTPTPGNGRRTTSATRCERREVVEAQLLVDALSHHESFEIIAVDASIPSWRMNALLRTRC
jgi:hypothetical protein